MFDLLINIMTLFFFILGLIFVDLNWPTSMKLKTFGEFNIQSNKFYI